MTVLSVRTFGFPEIRRDGQPCRLALRKGLALMVETVVTATPVRSQAGQEAKALRLAENTQIFDTGGQVRDTLDAQAIHQ